MLCMSASVLPAVHVMLPVLQLASRLEVLNRLRQGKAELAALKQDPLGTVVDTKSESLARLQAMRQQQQPKAAGGSQQQQQQEEADAGGGGGGPSSSGRAAAAYGSSGAAVAAAAAAAGGGGEEDAAAAASDGEEEGAGGDPYAGMNPRQRKLYELKQKMQQARKANENAIIAERKRMRVRGVRVEGVTKRVLVAAAGLGVLWRRTPV